MENEQVQPIILSSTFESQDEILVSAAKVLKSAGYTVETCVYSQNRCSITWGTNQIIDAVSPYMAITEQEALHILCWTEGKVVERMASEGLELLREAAFESLETREKMDFSELVDFRILWDKAVIVFTCKGEIPNDRAYVVSSQQCYWSDPEEGTHLEGRRISDSHLEYLEDKVRNMEIEYCYVLEMQTSSEQEP